MRTYSYNIRHFKRWIAKDYHKGLKGALNKVKARYPNKIQIDLFWFIVRLFWIYHVICNAISLWIFRRKVNKLLNQLSSFAESNRILKAADERARLKRLEDFKVPTFFPLDD